MTASKDPHTRELNRLRLALATFALQLDTVELRTHILLNAIDGGENGETDCRPPELDGHAGQ